MLILLVFGGLMLILSVFYLMNSWQQYHQWKWATFLVLISLAATVYGAINLPYWHRNSASSDNSSQTTSQSSKKNIKEFSNNGLQAQNGATQSQKEDAILRQLQKGYAKMGSVEFDRSSKTFKIEPNADSDNGKALNAIMQNPSQADQAGWPSLTKSLCKTSAALKKSLGDGYTLSLMKPGDNSSAMFSAKDGSESYNAIK